MLYYSEVTKQNYKTVTELEEAEKSFTESMEGMRSPTKKKLGAKKEDAETPTKRGALAKKVEEADKALIEAKAQLKDAEQEVERLSQEYLAKVDVILKEARARVSEAERVKYETIKAFNEEYGPYVSTVTDEKAVQDMINSIFYMERPLFRWFF